MHSLEAKSSRAKSFVTETETRPEAFETETSVVNLAGFPRIWAYFL